jgi:hypothetical protein
MPRLLVSRSIEGALGMRARHPRAPPSRCVRAGHGMHVHWVAVPEALRARRVNSGRAGHGMRVWRHLHPATPLSPCALAVCRPVCESAAPRAQAASAAAIAIANADRDLVSAHSFPFLLPLCTGAGGDGGIVHDHH